MILFVFVSFQFPIIATRRLLRLRAPERGTKEGPGNLSLVFLLGVLSLSLLFVHNDFLIGSTNSFSISLLALRRLSLLLFLSRSLCVRSVVLLKGFFCDLLVDLDTAGVRGVSSSGERAWRLRSYSFFRSCERSFASTWYTLVGIVCFMTRVRSPFACRWVRKKSSCSNLTSHFH